MQSVFVQEKNFKQKITSLFFSSGIQALIIYRLSNFLNKLTFFKKLKFPYLLYRLNQLLCNVDIDPYVTIGKNFLMPHPLGIVIGGTAIIGNNVTIMQNVTLGSRVIGSKGKRYPTLEDDVFAGPNAVILGDIIIGKNVQIGAGSIVLANVESGSTVIGVHK